MNYCPKRGFYLISPSIRVNENLTLIEFKVKLYHLNLLYLTVGVGGLTILTYANCVVILQLKCK